MEITKEQREIFYNQAKQMVNVNNGTECFGIDCEECFIVLLKISGTCNNIKDIANSYIELDKPYRLDK